MPVWVRRDIFEPSAFNAATDNIQENKTPEDTVQVHLKMGGTRTSEEDLKGTTMLEEKHNKMSNNRKHSSNTPAATVRLKFGYTKDLERKKEKPTTVGEQMDHFIDRVRTTRIQHAEEKRKFEPADTQPVLEIPITIENTPNDTKARKRKSIPADVVQLETDAKIKRGKEEKFVGRFSNRMADAVRTVCQICKKEVEFNQMRIHTRKAHEVGISEYKRMYGDLIANLVEAVYHKCTLCSQVLLLNGDVIASHAKKHRITHKEYNRRFIVGKKENLDAKEEQNLESKHEALMNDLEDNLTDMKTEKASGAELRRKLEQMSSDDLLRELDLLIASCSS